MREIRGNQSFYFRTKRIWWAAICIAVYDILFTGSMLLSTICCPIWFFISLFTSEFKSPGWKLALFKLGVPVLTFFLIIANSAYQINVANTNAKLVIAACEDYRNINRVYPDKLSKLVPKQLQSIPVAKHCLGPSSIFYYYFNFGKPILVWQVVPPYYRKIYDFGTKRWNYIE
jgi:hypothetical protein